MNKLIVAADGRDDQIEVLHFIFKMNNAVGKDSIVFEEELESMIDDILKHDPLFIDSIFSFVPYPGKLFSKYLRLKIGKHHN